MPLQQNETIWRRSWPAEAPEDLRPPFYWDAKDLVHIKSGLRLEEEYVKVPEFTVEEVAPHAMQCGAAYVDRWETLWGMSVGFSFPGSVCAWFLLDDYEKGKFLSLGVREIAGVFFGAPVNIRFGECIDAARYALSYGVPRDDQSHIEEFLSEAKPYPHKNGKLLKLWDGSSSMDHHTVVEALRYFQRRDGVTPYTVGAATKTIQIITGE